MTQLKELPEQQRNTLLHEGKLALQIGPYVYRLQGDVPALSQGLATLYGDFEMADTNGKIRKLSETGILLNENTSSVFTFETTLRNKAQTVF